MSFRCHLEDVELNVEIDYEPAQNGGLTDPSWDASLEVTEIKTLHGDDISSIINRDQLVQIESQIWDAIKEEREADEAERYERRAA
ncbi:hypothetical protein HQ393_05040 [Chitinibacter bivalviorum]|uniref:Uncharacterized protein n=1 Tax=Chitinibacter bivalviorum TaxID=2739434 RepID=A0A7H9BG37_9NEIS|nr:hypothetical protein [Chitinibacter bivalviorum]QLG87670.1 hypothetical protein HQ393_05040 [Chitinibacter bivalviorum]